MEAELAVYRLYAWHPPEVAMRLGVTLNLDEDLAAAFTSLLERGESGSTPEALMMAVLTALVERENGLASRGRAPRRGAAG